ncbi:unnamed protein product [Ilex paraguariensis]|uniref:Uncharacterized protein n=1 Tax=Ilex paraguariensis TaxID=185542 RepID=A0ABC8QXF0_9AQUA
MAEPRATKGLDRPQVVGGAINVGGIDSRENDTISVKGTINEKEGSAHGGWQPTSDASGVGETCREVSKHKLDGADGQDDTGRGSGTMGDAGGGLGAMVDADGGSGTLGNIQKREGKFSGAFGHLGNAGKQPGSDLEKQRSGGASGGPGALGEAMETLGVGEGTIGSSANCRNGSGSCVSCLGDGGNSNGILRLGGSLLGRPGTGRVDPCMGETDLGTKTPLREVDGPGYRGDRGTAF